MSCTTRRGLWVSGTCVQSCWHYKSIKYVQLNNSCMIFNSSCRKIFSLMGMIIFLSEIKFKIPHLSLGRVLSFDIYGFLQKCILSESRNVTLALWQVSLSGTVLYVYRQLKIHSNAQMSIPEVLVILGVYIQDT